MRILIDLQSCQNGSRFRGIGRYTLNLAKALFEIGKQHEFILLLSDRFPGTIEALREELSPHVAQDAFRICSLFDYIDAAPSDNAWRHAAANVLMSAFIADCRPDVVFVPSFFEGLWDNAIVPLPHGDHATVATIHDLIPLEDPGAYLPQAADRKAYVRRMQEARRVDRLIAISEYVAGEARQLFALAQDRICVAHNGVDASFLRASFRPGQHGDLMRRMGITKPFIYNNSPLEPRKNLECLIAGFASMAPALREGHQLVISGRFDEYGRGYLKSLVQAEGLSADTLVLPGYISDPDLIGLYATCSLFAFPSHSEGFGLPPLEAMACGAPVIVAEATSLPEVVDRADLRVDPRDPVAWGKAMGHMLSRPDVAAGASSYGRERAAFFTWEVCARKVLLALEDSVRNRAGDAQAVLAAPAAEPATMVALVCLEMDSASHVAGRLAVLAGLLDDRFALTLIASDKARIDPWLEAAVEVRTPDWFVANGWRFAHVIYAGDPAAQDDLATLMQRFPGLYLGLAPLADRPVDPIASAAVQRDLLAVGGVGGLIEGVLAKRKVLPSGERFRALADVSLREGAGNLPLLPVSRDAGVGKRYREEVQVPPEAPLIALVVQNRATLPDLLAQLRRLLQERGDAFAVVYREDDGARHEDALHLAGNVRMFDQGLDRHYRGLVSSADLVVLGSDIALDLRQRFRLDCAAIGLIEDDGNPWPVETGRGLSRRQAAEVAAPAVSEATTLWMAAIQDGLARTERRRVSQVGMVSRRLPGKVRGVKPTSGDLSQVARALAYNERQESEPLVCFDVSAFAAPGAVRRLDTQTRLQLLALLRLGGKAARAVYASGEDFVTANAFVADLLGLKFLRWPDEILPLGPGDKVVGLDCLRSCQSITLKALGRAWRHGAACLYVAAGQIGVQHGCEVDLAELVHDWIAEKGYTAGRLLTQPANGLAPSYHNAALAGVMQSFAKTGMPLSLAALDGAPAEAVAGWVEAGGALCPASRAFETRIGALATRAATRLDQGQALRYTVMGHLLGSYSLAIINRSVATTLEDNFPGRTHFLPFETDPIHHTEGVPATQKRLMIDLMERARPDPAHEIVICQHWPIMPPKERPRLALALFPWEESHVAHSIVHALNTGFDAIISPAQSVTDALTLSGCAIPAATIGQPADLAAFHALGREREPSRPIRRFLHISSGFPRKGIDVLLAAWAKAFTSQDDVELVIKTFPNPHNDVAEQVEKLSQECPDLARITLIDRDMEPGDVLGFYREYDAMVLPSRGEGYNLPALEAMAAGLPLIVTGHGGHRDFCGPDQARMIRYRFELSASHIAGSHSMWLKPCAEDLAEAMRELRDPGNAVLVEERREKALVAARQENDASGWIKRLNGMIEDLLGKAPRRTTRMGWVSTWDVQCGVAGYSAYLLDRMSAEQRAATIVYCDQRTPASTQGDAMAAKPVWTVIGDKAEAIVEAACRDGIETLVIQHQDGLISWEQLGEIGHHPALSRMASIAVLHNPTNLRRVGEDERRRIVEGLAKITRILVHTVEDMNFLSRMGLRRNLGLFPHGAHAPLDGTWPRDLGPHDAPIIGCHGFFFRHKGIDKLIRAAAKMRREWPNLRLRLVNARFPNGDHDEIIAECQRLAFELGMEDAIEWHLDFLPFETIESLLAQCDLIVLPYDESDDSASGAIRTSLATMVPLVATKVQIFADLRDAVGWARSNDPDELVNAIAPLLRSPKARREIQAGMREWLHAHDWHRMASILESLVTGLNEQRKLGWDQSRNVLA